MRHDTFQCEQRHYRGTILLFHLHCRPIFVAVQAFFSSRAMSWATTGVCRPSALSHLPVIFTCRISHCEVAIFSTLPDQRPRVPPSGTIRPRESHLPPPTAADIDRHLTSQPRFTKEVIVFTDVAALDFNRCCVACTFPYSITNPYWSVFSFLAYATRSDRKTILKEPS